MNVLSFLLQSLQTDAYDHYSAIYSLLADRLKKHKTLRVAQPTLRPISYPLNAVQVTHYISVVFCRFCVYKIVFISTDFRNKF